MNLPKAVIFDLDGVIVDTVPAHYVAWKSIAEELGVSFDEEANEALKGVSRIDSMKKILALGGLKRSDIEILELTTKKNKLYVDIISKMTADDILPGVIDFMDLLKHQGIKMAVGSSSKNTPTILKCIGLQDAFDAVVDGNQVTYSKPDPEVFLKGAIQLGESPEACVVIEDAISGIEAAINAKMKCIGIGEQEVLGKANVVIKSLSEANLDLLSRL
uniref:beta-phosphoglucomutase n=2 Tax=Roseivirga sp. TaxID=1964215 RepID=UPI004047678E